MIFLLLSIFSSSFLMVVFKIAGKRKLDAYNVIVINYITAAIIGFTLAGFPSVDILANDWLPSAIIIGILFIVVFLTMAYSTKESGIALTTVAVKMSVIIPITFSIIYFKEDLSVLKISGISLAMVAVYLTVYKKKEHRSKTRIAYILPLLLFVGSGTIDTLIKYTQATFLEEDSTILFTSVLFLIAGSSGIIYSPIRKKTVKGYFKRDIILTGMILGLINFGSLYGIVMALESKIFDSSIIFGINNIGIVVLSVTLALVIFRERLSARNKIGIALSIFTIIILSYVK
jgi:drug/metabolite transporter (DMT)-like permease